MSSLGLSKIMSRSRYSLNEDLHNRPSRSPSNQRLSNVGPKNPTFTSHVTHKSKLSSSAFTLSTGSIYLPKDYKPNQALDVLERKYNFFSNTFHFEKVLHNMKDTPQAAFSDQLKEIFELNTVLTKSPTSCGILNSQLLENETVKLQKVGNKIICNYARIITSRRMKELQVLGCLIMEIFLSNHLRAMGNYSVNMSFEKRLDACLLLLKCPDVEIPVCISYVVQLLLQHSRNNFDSFKYSDITELGLPQPSAHLLLQSGLNCIIPFSRHYPLLYKIINNLKDFKNVVAELNILYHFDCSGDMCSEYENLERRKLLFAQNIGECKVKSCATQLEFLLNEINTNTDNDIINILLPHIKELLEEPSTSVLSAWYLFEPIARALGPLNSTNHLLDSLLKLYDNEPSNINLPYMSKIAKLYHHSFLLRLMVRFGLKCFMENFVVLLVEAVGCYKDYDKVDFILHDHSEKVLKRSTHLKNMDSEQGYLTISNDFLNSDENNFECYVKKEQQLIEEDIFEFDDDKENEEQLKSLLEHLELNIASDLPFSNYTAEEALDAALDENIEHFQNFERPTPNSSDNLFDNRGDVISPTISIPSNYHTVSNISCEVGSRKSENDLFLDNKYDINVAEDEDPRELRARENKSEAKISEMSCDSLIWLSHRLGPVLTAKYISRNLLKMLTLCYVGSDNFKSITKENMDFSNVSIISDEVLGDQNSVKVLECLCSIAGKKYFFQNTPLIVH